MTNPAIFGRSASLQALADQKSALRSGSIVGKICRDMKEKEHADRLIEANRNHMRKLAELDPREGLRVRQTGSDVEYVIKRVEPGQGTKPPRIHVHGLPYPINPLTLVRA